jgi:hypothetical protein
MLHQHSAFTPIVLRASSLLADCYLLTDLLNWLNNLIFSQLFWVIEMLFKGSFKLFKKLLSLMVVSYTKVTAILSFLSRLFIQLSLLLFIIYIELLYIKYLLH